MDTSEDLIIKLDQQLENQNFKIEEFHQLFLLFMEQFKTKLRILDFKYYDEKRKSRMKKLKMKYVKIQDFEKAVEMRKLEKECDFYIELKTISEIEKSIFFHYNEHLYYFFTGTCLNDKAVRKYLNKFIIRSQKQQ